MSDLVKELCDIAVKAVELAKKHGADDAEVVVRDGAELTAKVRLGEAELVQEAGSRALGLRVFKDLRAAVTYTSDLRAAPLEDFVRETVTLAAVSEPDELNRLPDAADRPGARRISTSGTTPACRSTRPRPCAAASARRRPRSTSTRG